MNGVLSEKIKLQKKELLTFIDQSQQSQFVILLKGPQTMQNKFDFNALYVNKLGTLVKVYGKTTSISPM